MLTPEQIAFRRDYITATDVVAVTGEGYGSPHEVFETKCGDLPARPSSIAMEAGNALEAVIADWFARETRFRLTPGTTEVNPLIGWVAATPDRNIVDEHGKRIAVVEIKLVGSHRVGDWQDEHDGSWCVPPYVQIQVQWQLITVRLPRAYVAACLGDPTNEANYRWFVVEKDDALAGDLLTLMEDFRNKHILTKVPPPADGSEAAARMLAHRFPRVKRKELVLAPDLEALVERRVLLKAEIGQREEEVDAIDNALRERIQDREGVRGSWWKATWLEQGGGVAWEDLARHLGATPDQIGAFAKPSRRVLRVGKLTKKELAYVAAADGEMPPAAPPANDAEREVG